VSRCNHVHGERPYPPLCACELFPGQIHQGGGNQCSRLSHRAAERLSPRPEDGVSGFPGSHPSVQCQHVHGPGRFLHRRGPGGPAEVTTGVGESYLYLSACRSFAQVHLSRSHIQTYPVGERKNNLHRGVAVPLCIARDGACLSGSKKISRIGAHTFSEFISEFPFCCARIECKVNGRAFA